VLSQIRLSNCHRVDQFLKNVLETPLDKPPDILYSGCEVFHRGIMADIPRPARERLLQLMRIFEKHARTGNGGMITSAQVEDLTGWSRDTIRKDISFLGKAVGGTETGAMGGSAGYEPETLVPLIRKALELDRRRKFCVVGLGRLGSAYLGFTPPELADFELAAGFDVNVNRVEILTSSVPLYPAYKMAEVIARFEIEIALLCVPAGAAQEVAEKCVAAGVRGILYFAPVVLRLPPEVVVRNMYLVDELRSLSVNMGSFPKTARQGE